MKIYDRKLDRIPKTTTKVSTPPYINITQNNAYISSAAGRLMRVDKSKQIAFGEERRALFFGVAPKDNTSIEGWNATLQGKCGNVRAPNIVRTRFGRGKYLIDGSRTLNGVTWYRLKKMQGAK